MAACSSGTAKSIGFAFGIHKALERLTHVWRQLATVHAVGSVHNEHPVLAAAGDWRFAAVRLEADDVVSQTQAGAANARDPGADLQHVVDARRCQKLRFSAD